MLARPLSITAAISLLAFTWAPVRAVEFTVFDDGKPAPANAPAAARETAPAVSQQVPAGPVRKMPAAGPSSLAQRPATKIQKVDVTVPTGAPGATGTMDALSPPSAANGYPDPSIPFPDSFAPPDLTDVTVPLEPQAIQDPAAENSALAGEKDCAACGETMADGSCNCGQRASDPVGSGCAVNGPTGETSDAWGGDPFGGGGCSPGCRGCGCGNGRRDCRKNNWLSGLGQGCNGCNTNCKYCGNDEPGWFANLWVSSGYTYNNQDPASGSNLPLTFNDRNDKYLMNQLYASFGKAVSTSTWDVGGRIDVLYGSDYFFTTALGLETRQDGSQQWNSSIGPRPGAALYGVALPQAYAEFGVPFGAGTSIKVGHFYTILGYESVMAPENFFYSHAFTMQYGEPFTHTGVLGDVAVTKSLNVMGGVTLGWDTWENPNDKAGFLFGVSWCPTPVGSIAFGLHSSAEDANGDNNRTVYSMVYTRQLSNKLQYVMQHDFGTEALAEFDRIGERDSAKWYGINQYLFYEMNDCLTWGARVEWFRDQDNARVLGIPSETLVDGGNYFEMSLGANYRPNCRWIFRPEIRWDYSDVDPIGLGARGMFNDFNDDNQLTLAFDTIIRF